tara:strand:+ start:3041 stop:3868 length:828 start_codon:yes stop_codon:yes gene_type:complete
MIIWIASYPKSGNTWLRAFLSTYLYSESDKFDFSLLKKIPKFPYKKLFDGIINIEILKKDKFAILKYFIAAQQKLNLDNSIKLLKTHNAYLSFKGNWFSDEKNTKAFIYIVRDPRSVALSLSSYQNISVEKATDLMLNQNSFGSEDKDGLMIDIRSSWKINYLSWKKQKKFKGIIMKYEDLKKEPLIQFTKILNFLKNYIDLDVNSKKIKQCIDLCDFKKLQNLESKLGFDEAISSNPFFRKAELDEWKKLLNKETKNKIESNFGREMKELGYLS